MTIISKNKVSEIFYNIIVGLAVSIVMLNLGAALGILSGRGAFAGMLSAGLIAFITSAFGGTRIQGSGLTAPMSTVTSVIVAYALEQLPQHVAGVSADHFINIVLLMTALIMILFSVCKLGKYITYVPNLVISGFMCGIAIIIWTLQIDSLFGFNRTPIQGPGILNIGIALATFSMAFIATPLLKQISPKLALFAPGSLVALVTVSIAATSLALPVQYINIEASLNSLDDFTQLIARQIPTTITADVLMLALPFAVKLAILCYIDTLLTSLIIDKMCGSKTRQNKELTAQGMAIGAVALVGGVPGAQSTVPSVLTVKEGATMRVAGVFAGIFIILEMLLFANLMNYIPQAVFAGILLKVGYDVFDFKPFLAYARTIRRQSQNRPCRILRHKEMFVLVGTAITTAFVDLITAVAVFTIAYHVLNRHPKQKKMLNDYVPG
jgi:SulP family sulfate permease